MTNLIEKIREYKEMKRLADEALSHADSIADELKAYLTEAEKETEIIGEYKISFKEATRRDLDKKRLEADLGSLDEYTKITTYRRFLVA